MSTITRRNGDGLLRPFRTIISDLFDNDNFFEGEYFGNTSILAVNVKENEDDFEIELAVPGMKKEDFHIGVENGVLNISAETKEDKEEKDDNYTRKEFSYTSFTRSFTLPESVDKDDISAKYDQGLLKLTLLKKEEAKTQLTKTISID